MQGPDPEPPADAPSFVPPADSAQSRRPLPPRDPPTAAWPPPSPPGPVATDQPSTSTSPESAPTPAEKVVERPSPLTGIAHSGIVLAGSVVLFVREISENGLSDLTGMAVVVGVIALGSALIAFGAGIAAWRTTTFIVDDEEFRVERKFLWTSSSRVDYTKVQSVEINQPFIARLLGLAKVQIDVGGAGGVALSFLTLTRAEALREHLLARMRRARAVTPVGTPQGPAVPDGEAASGPPETALAEEPEVLVHAVPVHILFLGTLVSSTAFSLGTAALILLALYIWQDTGFTVLGALVAVAGWLWANIGSNWGFTVTRRGDTLRVRRGLTSTATQGLRPERIQGISIRQDLFQRLTGLYRVRVNVLGMAGQSGDDGKVDTSVLLPFGSWDDVLKILHVVWPHVDLSEIQPQPQPGRARWLTPLSHSEHTWGVGRDVVVAHHGLIEHTLTIVPHVRMQSLSLHQGPLQRRLRLASVALHTTDGPVSCRLYHLDEHTARQVFFEQLERAQAARSAAGG